VHLLGRAENGIHRAGLDATRTADTQIFVNQGYAYRTLNPILLVWWQRLTLQQMRQSSNGLVPAGGALVNLSVACDHRLRVGPAAWVATTCALNLRQQLVYLRDQVIRPRWQAGPGKGQGSA
jgi:hypothetical protein